jgi:hypothetical protein
MHSQRQPGECTRFTAVSSFSSPQESKQKLGELTSSRRFDFLDEFLGLKLSPNSRVSASACSQRENERFSTQIKSDDPGAERSRPALWSVFVFFRGRSEVLETVRPTVEEWS